MKDFAFDKSAIRTLRLLPYLSFNDNNTSEGIDFINKQRETSGQFIMYGVTQNETKQIVYNLSLETSYQEENSTKTIQYIVGTSETVPMSFWQRGFHTHPFINYYKYNVLIGPPSGKDLNNFVIMWLESVHDINIRPYQFYAVISIEGIYIYSLTKSGILYVFQNGVPNGLEEHYEYPYSERHFNWKQDYYNENDKRVYIKEDSVEEHLVKYFNWFNQVNANFNNLFDMKLLRWKDLTENTVTQIEYFNEHIYQEIITEKNDEEGPEEGPDIEKHLMDVSKNDDVINDLENNLDIIAFSDDDL
jgi:hypothetical protein